MSDGALVADYVTDMIVKEISRQVSEEMAAIVRALADAGPIDVNRETGHECGYCGYAIRSPRDSFNDPASHNPRCLWRRAKVLDGGIG